MLRDLGDALLGRGRRDERNQVEPAPLQRLGKALRRLCRKVGDQHSGKTRLGRILRHVFEAVAQQRIEITEEHDRNSGGLHRAGCDFKHGVQFDAAGQRALAGTLNHGAIGCGIAERHTHLDGRGSAARHGNQQFVSGLQGRDRPP